MTAYPFPAPPFAGHPVVLLGLLRPLGIEERQWPTYRPCVEYRDDEGRWVREIGEVMVFPDGRIAAYPRSDVDDRDRVSVLRGAERVITHGTHEGGWFDVTSPRGVVYRKSTVLAYLTDVEGPAVAAMARDQRTVRTEVILDELSRIELSG